MPDTETIVDHLGEVRAMGLNRVGSDHLMMRASRQNFRAYLESIGKGLIPRADWKPVNRRKELGTDFILDQRSSSGCTGFSAAHALMRLRVMRGMTFQKLSGAFVYSQINGGHDNGSVIVEALKVLENQGTCLESEFNFPHLFDKEVPQQSRETAKRFRLLMGLTFDTVEEGATALQLGYLIQGPMQVGPPFEKFVNGVAGFSKGYGNHSGSFDGMDFIDGKWCFDFPNTWGGLWGPYHNGRCYISEQAFAGQGGSDDSYVLIDAAYDPQDPNLPPKPVE